MAPKNDANSFNGSSDERESLLEALDRTDWNKAKAARLLGISRPTLYQKIKSYKIAPSD